MVNANVAGSIIIPTAIPAVNDAACYVQQVISLLLLFYMKTLQLGLFHDNSFKYNPTHSPTHTHKKKQKIIPLNRTDVGVIDYKWLLVSHALICIFLFWSYFSIYTNWCGSPASHFGIYAWVN